VTGERLVDGVVHNLPDEVVQTTLAGRADVHARTLADRLEAFEHGDGLDPVFLLLLCHPRPLSRAGGREAPTRGWRAAAAGGHGAPQTATRGEGGDHRGERTRRARASGGHGAPQTPTRGEEADHRWNRTRRSPRSPADRDRLEKPRSVTRRTVSGFTGRVFPVCVNSTPPKR